MKRLILIISSALCCLVAVALFKIKYDVIDCEKKILKLNKSIKKTTKTIHVLKAEWAFLNNPERLKKLSDKYLKMTPVRGNQMATPKSLHIIYENLKKEQEKREKKHPPKKPKKLKKILKKALKDVL